MRKVMRSLNEYFFDVQEDEEPDYVGAAFFYVPLLVMVFTAAFVAVNAIL